MMNPCSFTRWRSTVVSSRRAVAPLGELVEVVPGDEAAQRHPRPDVEQRQHRAENRATDILEIHIDTLGAGSREAPGQLGLMVIEALIEPQRLERVPALLAAAGHTDGTAPLDPGKLPHHRSDPPCGAAIDARLACFALPGTQQ